MPTVDLKLGNDTKYLELTPTDYFLFPRFEPFDTSPNKCLFLMHEIKNSSVNIMGSLFVRKFGLMLQYSVDDGENYLVKVHMQEASALTINYIGFALLVLTIFVLIMFLIKLTDMKQQRQMKEKRVYEYMKHVLIQNQELKNEEEMKMNIAINNLTNFQLDVDTQNQIKRLANLRDSQI